MIRISNVSVSLIPYIYKWIPTVYVSRLVGKIYQWYRVQDRTNTPFNIDTCSRLYLSGLSLGESASGYQNILESHKSQI